MSTAAAVPSLPQPSYNVIRRIGEGAFGQAFLCERTSTASGQAFEKQTKATTPNHYVLKEIPTASMSDQERTKAEMELGIMASYGHHPFVVKLEEGWVGTDCITIIMEYCTKGDMSSLIKGLKGKLLPECTVLNYLAQIILAISHLKKYNIMHRDIKPDNIFMGKDSYIRIVDFGLASMLDPSDPTARHDNEQVGTPCYMSPEIVGGKPYDYRSDIWSVGVIMYELMNKGHKVPFDDTTLIGLAAKIARRIISPNLLDASFSLELRQLVVRMLNKDPSLRPGVEELLREPCLANAMKTLRPMVAKRTAQRDAVIALPAASQVALSTQPASTRTNPALAAVSPPTVSPQPALAEVSPPTVSPQLALAEVSPPTVSRQLALVAVSEVVVGADLMPSHPPTHSGLSSPAASEPGSLVLSCPVARENSDASVTPCGILSRQDSVLSEGSSTDEGAEQPDFNSSTSISFFVYPTTFLSTSSTTTRSPASTNRNTRAKAAGANTPGAQQQAAAGNALVAARMSKAAFWRIIADNNAAPSLLPRWPVGTTQAAAARAVDSKVVHATLVKPVVAAAAAGPVTATTYQPSSIARTGPSSSARPTAGPGKAATNKTGPAAPRAGVASGKLVSAASKHKVAPKPPAVTSRTAAPAGKAPAVDNKAAAPARKAPAAVTKPAALPRQPAPTQVKAAAGPRPTRPTPAASKAPSPACAARPPLPAPLSTVTNTLGGGVMQRTPQPASTWQQTPQWAWLTDLMGGKAATIGEVIATA